MVPWSLLRLTYTCIYLLKYIALVFAYEKSDVINPKYSTQPLKNCRDVALAQYFPSCVCAMLSNNIDWLLKKEVWLVYAICIYLEIDILLHLGAHENNPEAIIVLKKWQNFHIFFQVCYISGQFLVTLTFG